MGNKEWANLYAATREVNWDQQLWDASVFIFHDSAAHDRETLFFLCANAKAKI